MPSCACTYVYTYKCVLAKQPNKTSLFTHILEELIYIYIYIYIYIMSKLGPVPPLRLRVNRVSCHTVAVDEVYSSYVYM